MPGTGRFTVCSKPQREWDTDLQGGGDECSEIQVTGEEVKSKKAVPGKEGVMISVIAGWHRLRYLGMLGKVID